MTVQCRFDDKLTEVHMAIPPRSSELMTPEDIGLLLDDLQETLVPVITDHTTITWYVSRLFRAAYALVVPTAATE